MPFADERGSVTQRIQDYRKRLEPVAQFTPICVVCYSMIVSVFSGQITGTAWRTQWGSCESIFEPHAFPHHPVYIGRLDVIVTCGTKFIPTKIIHQYKYNIGF